MIATTTAFPGEMVRAYRIGGIELSKAPEERVERFGFSVPPAT